MKITRYFLLLVLMTISFLVTAQVEIEGACFGAGGTLIEVDEESGRPVFEGIIPIDGTSDLVTLFYDAGFGEWTIQTSGGAVLAVVASDTDLPPATTLAAYTLNECSGANPLSVTGASTLPVEWTYFTAVANEKRNVLLSWETASEEDNRGFFVERSTNAVNWTDLEFIRGQGATGNATQYEFMDRNAAEGINYYRLRQTDYDGAISYSETRAVNIFGSAKVNLVPNPASGTVQLQGVQEVTRVVIRDQTGRSMLQLDALLPGTTINLTTLPAATYFVQFTSGNEVTVKKLTVNQ